ncbi:MAG: hypothetical protein VZR09_06265 [Candidatus Gastranaerophilaceae bacterium]|nr:hypothetical protein [Candidatus Gastranaerophilaceae bacterium]
MHVKNFIVCCLILGICGFAFCRNVSVAENSQNVEQSLPEKYVKPTIDKAAVEKKADFYFYKGIENSNKKIKEVYLSKALEKYMLLLKYNQNNVIYCTQIAVIHDNLGHPFLAKQYFIRAVNLENLNPFANFYFGEYYFNKKDYNNALKYYKTAYNNGYQKFYQVNIKLATIYEKLGDIEKAKYYYSASNKQNPSIEGVDSKIKSLNKVYYSKSDYKM